MCRASDRTGEHEGRGGTALAETKEAESFYSRRGEIPSHGFDEPEAPTPVCGRARL